MVGLHLKSLQGALLDIEKRLSIAQSISSSGTRRTCIKHDSAVTCISANLEALSTLHANSRVCIVLEANHEFEAQLARAEMGRVP